MKPTFFFFLIITLPQTELWAQNLVVNPGFELESGELAEWNVGVVSNGAAAMVDEKEFHRGTQSLCLDQPVEIKLPEGAGLEPNLVKFITAQKAGGVARVSQDISVEEGKSCDFTFWYKTQGLLQENNSDLKLGFSHLLVWISWLQGDKKPVEGDLKTKGRWVLSTGIDAPDWVEAVNKGYNYSSRAGGYPCVAPRERALPIFAFSLL